MSTAANRPTPPDDLDGEALASTGQLAAADRALITLYCQTWAVNQQVAKHVAKFGAIIKWSNGVPGQSPWAKQQKETTAQLCKMLEQLNLTPSSRETAPTETTDDAINF